MARPTADTSEEDIMNRNVISPGSMSLTVNGTLRMDVQSVRPVSLQLDSVITASTLKPRNSPTASGKVTTSMSTAYGF
jgi:hypothetical protein